MLPPLDEQQRIAYHLDQATAQADALLERARQTVELVRQLRLARLQEVFGPMQGVHERLRNPIPGLGGLVELKVGGPADFYVQRSGTEGNVGRPFREAFPESPGGARRGPGDPRNHIGVTVLRLDLLDPGFLFYVAEYAWRSRIYQRLCHGTLTLQHLRLRDVACGLSAAMGPRENPVRENPMDAQSQEVLRVLERLSHNQRMRIGLRLVREGAYARAEAGGREEAEFMIWARVWLATLAAREILDVDDLDWSQLYNWLSVRTAVEEAERTLDRGAQDDAAVAFEDLRSAVWG